MIPRLTDDPAWVRYEWDLRHLALLELMRAQAEMFAEFARQLVPTLEEFTRNLRDAFAAYARTPAMKAALLVARGPT